MIFQKGTKFHSIIIVSAVVFTGILTVFRNAHSLHMGILIVLLVVARNPSMVRKGFVMNVFVTALFQPCGEIRILAFHNLLVVLRFKFCFELHSYIHVG